MKFEKNRKAQMEQVFTYIMTGIIIVAVLGFGIVQIMKLVDTSDEIECLQFKQDLQEIVSGSKSYNNIQKMDFYIECDYKYIWFVDLDKCENKETKGLEYNPIIKNSCEDGVLHNVFMGNKYAEDFFYVEGLNVQGDVAEDVVLKFDLNGNKNIFTKFQGTGSGMIISRDTSGIDS